MYPYYDQFHGRMHKFTQVEPMVYEALHETAGYPTKYWTMPELFKYARDKLHVNYMIWVRMPNASPADSYEPGPTRCRSWVRTRPSTKASRADTESARPHENPWPVQAPGFFSFQHRRRYNRIQQGP